MRIGVLAIQGSFSLHIRCLERIGVFAEEIRRPSRLKGLSGIIIPGGESTTFERILERDDFGDLLRSEIRSGLPTWGTCAGAIMLGSGDGKPQPRWNLIDVEVERNAYGRQVDSFVAPLGITGFNSDYDGVFIRAPKFSKVGKTVEVLSYLDNDPVMIRQNNIIISAFHPELTPDPRVHEYFIKEHCLKSGRGIRKTG